MVLPVAVAAHRTSVRAVVMSLIASLWQAAVVERSAVLAIAAALAVPVAALPGCRAVQMELARPPVGVGLSLMAGRAAVDVTGVEPQVVSAKAAWVATETDLVVEEGEATTGAVVVAGAYSARAVAAVPAIPPAATQSTHRARRLATAR